VGQRNSRDFKELKKRNVHEKADSNSGGTPHIFIRRREEERLMKNKGAVGACRKRGSERVGRERVD